ncbi:MAG: L,D-transpeptidase [Chitinophagales bacterium]
MWVVLLAVLLFSGNAVKETVSLRIEKHAQRLMVLKGKQLIGTYHCVFGGNPVDDKQQQGDGCTPEGVFKVCGKYPHAKWQKFIWIDYPNQESKKRFSARKKAGTIPANAQIGGDIGIHGTPNDQWVRTGENWTLGCISLTSADIEAIYPLVSVGTTVEIVH